VILLGPGDYNSSEPAIPANLNLTMIAMRACDIVIVTLAVRPFFFSLSLSFFFCHYFFLSLSSFLCLETLNPESLPRPLRSLLGAGDGSAGP
jgi:hypothetical protein